MGTFGAVRSLPVLSKIDIGRRPRRLPESLRARAVQSVLATNDHFQGISIDITVTRRRGP